MKGLFDDELVQMTYFGPPPPDREAQQAYHDTLGPGCSCEGHCPGHGVSAEDHARAREVMQQTITRLNLDFSRPRPEMETTDDGGDDQA